MTRMRQAVFLVGGRGTRLGTLARDTPKPLLELQPGLRFLDVLLEEAARHGFTDLLLLAGHLGEQVADAYHGRSVRGATVSVVREPEPMGTGGALRMVADRLDPEFLMFNGDSLFDINLRALATCLRTPAQARLALRVVADPGRYGSVVCEDGLVRAFMEKCPDQTGPGLVNAGIYHLHRSILDRISGPCSIERDVFPRMAREGRIEASEFSGYFLDIGLPDTYAEARRDIPVRRSRPCAFLDRDGVLNVDHGYTHRPDQLVWIDGARDAVRRLNDAGHLVVVVTNQSGIARGFFTDDDLARFHHAMADDLAEVGAHIDAWYHCPYHADAVLPAYAVADHPDRKPNPGMLLRAMAEWPIRKDGSFLIGDKASDLAAAQAAGLPGHLFAGGNLLEQVDRLLGRL